MRRLPVVAGMVLAGVAVAHCEQRFSSTAPVAPDSVTPAPSSGAVDALLTPATNEAGAALPESRAMTVTLCSASPQPCAAPDTDASSDDSYRVVFGSGRAEIRSRGQAMADVYKELRDRTTAGERLAVIPRAPRSSGGAYTASGRASARAGGDTGDDISRSAFHLLDLVDGVGEVVVELLPRFASSGCIIALGRPGGDGGIPQCLIKEPERARRGH
jgi:hypothetical protein